MTTSNTAPSVSRRTALAGLGAGGLGLALAATDHPAGVRPRRHPRAHGRPPDGRHLGRRPEPGAPSDAPTLAVFTADGAIIDPVWASAGAWQATGPRSAAWTLVGLSAGVPSGYSVVRVTGEVDAAGTSYAASKRPGDLVAPDGTVVATSRVRHRGIRLHGRTGGGRSARHWPGSRVDAGATAGRHPDA